MLLVRRVGAVSRRSFIIGGSALLLSACGGDDPSDALASAGKGESRQQFTEALAWMAAQNTFSIAFVPYRLSDSERRDVVASQTLFPTLARKDPMVHMRVETSGDSLDVSSIRSVELIFWHFDPLPTVIKEKVAGNPDTVMNFANLSGAIKKGGFAIGTIRGQTVVESKTSARPTSFVWNLGFQVSLA